MKKGLICITLSLIVILSSCAKKDVLTKDDQYIDGWTRVLGVKANDTSATKYVNGRVEALALATDQDSQLKAELTGYMPLPRGQGQYIVKMTNLTTCQMILRWNWDNLAITSIIPTDTTGGPDQYDVLKANVAKTYIIIGKAVPGTLFVKSVNINSSCSPSKELKIIITTTILPIEFTSITRKRTGDKVVVNWSTETPGDVSHFLVMWTETGDQKDEVCKYILDADPNKKNYTATYPAVRKTK